MCEKNVMNEELARMQNIAKREIRLILFVVGFIVRGMHLVYFSDINIKAMFMEVLSSDDN